MTLTEHPTPFHLLCSVHVSAGKELGARHLLPQQIVPELHLHYTSHAGNPCACFTPHCSCLCVCVSMAIFREEHPKETNRLLLMAKCNTTSLLSPLPSPPARPIKTHYLLPHVCYLVRKFNSQRLTFFFFLSLF